ncbi:MAG: Maltodextrin ABC transporter, permease protein MdxF [uncultured Solirubrobacteraceae bacterium]|uniref:Maltodextrin ABC transporter, permease protein MdxF n=1 Tax=uncultured Solirubrobacteraceae bacterium TaxID=1162706 RepID=A0A6J4TGT8_9ACTN|nr:MAG: Maltodextrin ABC transporter, permease protein MdxF [uncultured Solirubrobacteraceae bacterium]
MSTPASTVAPAVSETTDPGRVEKPQKKALTERARAERKLGWMLCAPAALVMLAVTAYPILNAIWLSLQKSDLRFPGQSEFIGLDNYVTVLSSSLWWTDVWHTVVLTVISVAIELVLGMLLALAMHRAIFGRGLIRTSALIPYGIVTVVAAFAWRLAFSDADGGFMPGVLRSVGLLGAETDPLAQTSTFSTYVVAILAEVWKTTPFMALLLLAGLALVSDELHEAAKVDGATTWQRFWRITIPLMKPAILVALLFRTLDAFRIFDTVFVLSNNGSNRSVETVSVLGYNTLLSRLNLGLGSAVSVLIFLCVVLIAAMFVKGLGTNLAQQRGE